MRSRFMKRREWRRRDLRAIQLSNLKTFGRYSENSRSFNWRQWLKQITDEDWKELLTHDTKNRNPRNQNYAAFNHKTVAWETLAGRRDAARYRKIR